MNEFGRLNQKNILWILFALMLSLAVGGFFLFFFVDGLWQDPFANFCVDIFRRLFGLDRPSAVQLYDRIFRQHKIYWVASGFGLLLIFCLYLSLNRFNRYFRQTTLGVDRLLTEDGRKIDLPPELEFMEKKLNTVKATLERRARETAEAESRKNELVMYLAHDIRTPLTSVVGYLSLLDEARSMPQELREKYIRITLEKAERLEELIEEFFEITRFHQQGLSLNLAPLDLSYLLLQIKEEFYPMLEPGRLSVSLETESGLFLVGDGDKLARVFNNILKNAVAYSRPESEIKIRARSREKEIEICFINQGEEIPEKELSRIFEKFYRLDNARSTNTGGAGLGLAIAREIVAAHGGRIQAASDEEDTRFIVTLPAAGPQKK